MNHRKRPSPFCRNLVRAGVLFLLSLTAGAPPGAPATNSLQTGSSEQAVKRQFFCNRQALNPAERAHHRQLTDKLMASRKKIVESERGYEFQFSASTVSLTELSDWVAAEARCCSFFDFHIDLEEKGRLLCLRLTGQPGIKPFIRAEFNLPEKP